MDAAALDDALAGLDRDGFGDRAFGLVADLSDVPQVAAMMAEAHARLGRLDVLVNNAGGSAYTPPDLEDVSESDFDRVMGWNVKSTFFCTKAAIPRFRAQGGGAIVNMSAISGRAGTELLPPQYSAAKAAVIGLTRNLARHFGPEGIRVNTVAPGFIRSGPRVEAIWNARDPEKVLATIPLRRRGEMSEVAQAVLFLASDAAAYVTGAVLDVNGGFLCV
jgi:NAD(P)-dependent dehydrogenase (short-subunit alcohol dehydrogenase family)